MRADDARENRLQGREGLSVGEDRFIEGGRSWVALTTLAGCFECEVTWLDTVYARGLLGEGIARSGMVLVESQYVEQLAVVYRMTFHYGLDLETVELLLAEK